MLSDENLPLGTSIVEALAHQLNAALRVDCYGTDSQR
jgi:hypothetical protein